MLRCLVRLGERGSGLQSSSVVIPWGKYGKLEESTGPGLDGSGDNFVYEEKVSGGRARNWSGPRRGRIGISGEVRARAACVAGLFRSRHASDGDGWASGQANH